MTEATVSSPSALLDTLNGPQRASVTTTRGPLMVLAGAGSGKTRVLTHRIAWLIATGEARSHEILAVTFTNKAAREMRTRAEKLIGAKATGWIGTFHGTGARILRENGAVLDLNTQFTILDQSDSLKLIQQLARETGFNDVHWTPKRLAHTFSRWKDDGLTPADIGEEQIGFNYQPVATFFSHYQQTLRRKGCLDFGDLLSECLTLWRKAPEILERLQSRFRFILVDEYQDINTVQYQWLKHLAARHQNLCVVGDDDQSIYSWRGARTDTVFQFEKDFPKTKIIRLEQNYRSTGTILEAASSLIRNNKRRMAKKLWTEDASGPPLTHYTAKDGYEEASFVAEKIKELCRNRPFGHAAVLVRSSRQTRLVEEALMIRNMPYHLSGGTRFLDRAEIKDAVAYLRLVESERDDLAFERIINTPRRGLGKRSLEAIRQVASRNNGSLLEAAREIIAQRDTLRAAARNALTAFVKLMDQAAAMMLENVELSVLLEKLLTDSGIWNALRQDERGDEKRENLNELITMIHAYQNLGLFLENAVLATDMRSEDHESREGDRVTLSTLHAAKGLEFSYVFLIGMEENLLPHSMALRETREAGLEEERRLAYVGMTRARERLFLTHARRRRFYDRIERTLPSRFLKEVPSHLLKVDTGRFF